MRRGSAVYLCGGDLRPGPRASECPNELHDWPLPTGYADASDVAMSRLRRRWANPRCTECGRFGWRPSGDVNPETDVRTSIHKQQSEEES
jgi:hypothetical protein